VKSRRSRMLSPAVDRKRLREKNWHMRRGVPRTTNKGKLRQVLQGLSALCGAIVATRGQDDGCKLQLH